MDYDINTLKEIDDLATTTLHIYEDYRNDFEEHIRKALLRWLDTEYCKVEVTSSYLEVVLPKNCMLGATQLYALEYVLGCEFIQTVNTDVRKYHFRWV